MRSFTVSVAARRLSHKIYLLLCVHVAQQISAMGPRRKKRTLTEAERQARRNTESRRAYQFQGTRHRPSDESFSESEEGHSTIEDSDSFGEGKSKADAVAQATNIVRHTGQQAPASHNMYSTAYDLVMGKVHDFEISDDESDVNEPSSQTARPTISDQHPSASSSLATSGINNAESDETLTGRQTSASSTTEPSRTPTRKTVVVASVHQPPAPQADGDHMHSPAASPSAFGNNGAVADERFADAISEEASASSHGRPHRLSVTTDTSSMPSGTAQQHEFTGEKHDSLSDLVSKGVGSGKSCWCLSVLTFTFGGCMG